MVEIKENFHQEEALEIKRKNDFHHLFDEAQRAGDLEKIDNLQREYNEKFGHISIGVVENADVSQETAAAKSRIGLLREHLSSLPPAEQQKWLADFNQLPNKSSIEGVLAGYKPACYLKQEEADFVLAAGQIKDVLRKSPAKTEGFCFLYDHNAMAEIIKKNLDVFIDLPAGHIFDQLDHRSDANYLSCLRMGLLLGYNRSDVEMYAKYENAWQKWTDEEIFANGHFSLAEKAWLKLYYFFSIKQKEHCLLAIDNILDNVLWLEKITDQQRAEITDLFCQAKTAIEARAVWDKYLEVAHILQPIIYQQILEKEKMSPFLKSYFLNRRILDVQGVRWISYGHNGVHQAIAARAEKLSRESGLKNLVEQSPLGHSK